MAEKNGKHIEGSKMTLAEFKRISARGRQLRKAKEKGQLTKPGGFDDNAMAREINRQYEMLRQMNEAEKISRRKSEGKK